MGRMSYFDEDIYDVQTSEKHMKPILGAIVSGVLVSVLGYIMSLTDIWSIDFKAVVNIAVMTAVASLLKFLGTTNKGNFAGAIPVSEPK